MTGAQFKSNLVDLGISQAKFAARIEVRPSTVSEWVNDHAPVPGYAVYIVKLLRAIAELQEVTK